jgi:hypothetical protein
VGYLCWNGCRRLVGGGGSGTGSGLGGRDRALGGSDGARGTIGNDARSRRAGVTDRFAAKATRGLSGGGHE